MRCPFCSHNDTVVKDSRPDDEQPTIKRRRLCTACGSRFTTVERVQLRDLLVLKRNGDLEAFSPDKLSNALRLALHKRPFSGEQVERIAASIARQLEVLGEGEIASSLIGQKALEALATLDGVAYVRFASIYQDFKNLEDFQTVIERAFRGGMAGEGAPPPAEILQSLSPSSSGVSPKDDSAPDVSKPSSPRAQPPNGRLF